jgi:hypothetical protein
MTTTDPNPPITPVDTTGGMGSAGALSQGTARTASNADTTIFGGGGGEDPNLGNVSNSATGTISTSGTDSANSATFVPTGTGISGGEPDSTQGGGSLRVDANPAYRAPSGPVSVGANGELDTTRTDSPTSGTVLVTNKAYVKSTKIATIITDGTYNLVVGQIAVLVGVDANLDGTQTIATVPTPGTFTFITDKPSVDIVSAAVIGGSVSITTMGYLSGTTESANVGAVPATGTTPLVAPTGVTATATAGGGVLLGWTPAAQSGGAVVKRWFIESDRGYSQHVPANVTSFDTSSAWLLQADQPITFTVRAANDYGDSPKSVASASVTPKNVNFNDYAGGVFPDAALNPVYTPSGNVNFFLVGTQNRNGINYTWVLPPTNHAYSAGVLKVFNAATGVQVGGDYVLAGSANSQAVTGLTYGTTYYATVSMTNSVGTITDDAVTTVVALLAPAAAAAPTGVDAGAGSHNATITYVDPADTGGSAITSHVIQWSSDSFVTVAGSTTDAVSPATASSGAGTWKFRVAAVNAVGTGAFSAASANVTVA